MSTAIRKIKNAIKEIKKEVPIRAAKRLEKQMPKLVENAMNQFYLSYSPTVYKRTYGLHRGIINGFSTRISKEGFYITFSSDFIPDHLHDSGEYIFMGAFMQGIHGTTEVCVSTPPWMIFEDNAIELYEQYANEEVDKVLKKYDV